MNHFKSLVEYLKSKNSKWQDILSWFENYKPEDRGIQFIWDSFYTDKYLQSKHMYAGMLRQVLYLYRYLHDPQFLYNYSSKRVNTIDNFFKTQFVLREGTFAGKPFILEPNQVYKLSLMYGFSLKEEFKPIEKQNKGIVFMVNRFYDTETRKNGKSMFFGGLGDFVVLNPFQNDNKPEVYASGPLKDSSNIIYQKARDLAKSNAWIAGEFKAVGERRFETMGGGIIKDLAFEIGSLEGKNPSLGIATEYHLHNNDMMVNSFESAQNISRINSILVFDTTKGHGIYGVAYTREMDYKQTIMQQLENPESIFGSNIATFMAEVDDEDNPDDIDNPWETNPLRKSTPMLGIITSLSSLQQEWSTAKLNPTRRIEFLVKKFGKWIGNLQSMFELQDLKKCDDRWKDKYKIEDFKGANALLAIDLANTSDTNAVSLVFKVIENDVEIPVVFSKIFIPEKTLQERIDKEKKPYIKWIEDKWVQTSGERAVDHKDIAFYINECLKDYKIDHILYDPYQMHIIKSYLIDLNAVPSNYFNAEDLETGKPIGEVKQSAGNLSSPMEDLIKRIYDGNFYFFGNPVLIDHFINMKPSYNSQGQVYWTKQKQEQRVDIFATVVTAMKKFDKLLPYQQKRSNNMEVWIF